MVHESPFYGPGTRSVQGPFVVDQDYLDWHIFCQKNLEHFQQNLQHGKYRILADLDSTSKVGICSQTPLPHWT